MYNDPIPIVKADLFLMEKKGLKEIELTNNGGKMEGRWVRRSVPLLWIS